MDYYDCIEAVDYARVKFSPEAEIGSKERTIMLPVNTPVDDTIRKHFKKRRGVHDHPPKEEEKTHLELDNRPDEATILARIEELNGLDIGRLNKVDLQKACDDRTIEYTEEEVKKELIEKLQDWAEGKR